MTRLRPEGPSPELVRHAAIDFAVAGVLIAMCLIGRSAAFATATAAVYTAIALLALAGLRDHAPQRSLGGANRVTLIRAIMVSFVGGAAAVAPAISPAEVWLLAGMGAVASALDGADGWMARRQGTASRFGAMFDQEIDALFILLLSVTVWRLDQTGPWVLAIGAMRYAFLLLGAVAPGFRRPLPQRRRRQAICVVQVVVLLACLPPLLPAWLRDVLTIGALAMLSASFAADIGALARRGGPADIAA